MISKCRHRIKLTLASYDSMNWNSRCKVEISWNFLSLWQPDLLLLWRRFTKTSSFSINFKGGCILCGIACGIATVHADTFYKSKGDFLHTLWCEVIWETNHTSFISHILTYYDFLTILLCLEVWIVIMEVDIGNTPLRWCIWCN